MSKKFRLTKDRRQTLRAYMLTVWGEKNIKIVLEKGLEAIKVINLILRKEYPEADMAILRKYNATRKDTCLRFINPERPANVFGIRLEHLDLIEALADIPSSGGCYSNRVFEVAPAHEQIILAYDDAQTKYRSDYNKKWSEYDTFLEACKTLDEVLEATGELPDSLLIKIGAIKSEGGALTIMNPELISSIKKDFAHG